MPFTVMICARCTTPNHPSTRFCTGCSLPLGTLGADAEAGTDALGPYEAPDPRDADADVGRRLAALVAASGFEATPSGHGWRMVVPLPMDRRQAVYAGFAGADAEGRAILALVSVCGPATDRDARGLLKLNARIVEGHFAIKVLLGEEYFVVIHNLAVTDSPAVDPAGLVRRVAETADGLEDKLSRGRDLY